MPGVAALVAMQVAFWRTAMSAYRRPLSPQSRALALGLMGSMAGALAHGLVDTAYFLPDLALVFMLTLGLTGRLAADTGPGQPHGGGHAPRPETGFSGREKGNPASRGSRVSG